MLTQPARKMSTGSVMSNALPRCEREFTQVRSPLKWSLAIGEIALAIATLTARSTLAQEQKAANTGGPAFCKLFKPVAANTQVDTDLAETLVGVYNAQARKIQSLKTVAEVRVFRGPKFGALEGKSKPVGAYMDYAQPSWLRVIGVVPVSGTRIFDMASDDRDFHLLAADGAKMKFYVGPNDLPADFRAGNLGLRPQEFLDALRWVEGRSSVSARERATRTGTTVTVNIDLPPRAGKPISGSLQFDVAAGTVSSLKLFNADGSILSEIHYSDWRVMARAPSEAGDGCFPWKIQVLHPVEDFEIDLRILEVTLNPKLDRSRFHIGAPRGVPTIHVTQ